MRRNKFECYLLIIFLIILIIIVLSLKSNAHETKDFKHMIGNSGPIIQTQMCEAEIRLWTIKKDSEIICKKIIFSHGKLHEKIIEPINGECKCNE